MAATSTPLIWDSHRSVGAVDGLCGNVHYYDEAGQAIYLHGGIATQVTQVNDGHWDEAVYGSEIVIDSTAYTLLTVDHPSNGVLHFAATDGTSLVYLRYLYAMDISDLIASGTWQEQTDNRVKQISLDVRNLGEEVFAASNTLFNPGAKLSLSFTAGDAEPYPIGTAYLDELTWDLYAETVPVSGRNSIGYRLSQQTMDGTTSITGTGDVVVRAILALAGITKIVTGPSDDTHTHTFRPEQTLLEALDQVCSYYDPWRMAELPDGTIVIGYPWFISPTYQQNSTYTFDGGAQVFKRQTSKSADAAYTHLRVTGKDGSGAELTPVTVAVSTWDYWDLGEHRTKHVAAPDGLTQAQLASYAASVADGMQYVGVGESFSGPLRPWLLVGDVAAVYYSGDSAATSLGLITELTHRWGDGGFFTDFSIDSGGKVTDASGYIYTRNAALRGYNRRQRITDLIQVQVDRRTT